MGVIHPPLTPSPRSLCLDKHCCVASSVFLCSCWSFPHLYSLGTLPYLGQVSLSENLPWGPSGRAKTFLWHLIALTEASWDHQFAYIFLPLICEFLEDTDAIWLISVLLAEPHPDIQTDDFLFLVFLAQQMISFLNGNTHADDLLIFFSSTSLLFLTHSLSFPIPDCIVDLQGQNQGCGCWVME